ncbi:MAG: hydroxyisourate hydrolase [Pseudomonadota bacterium]
MASENGKGRLTTHVLDTTRGRPAAGLALSLWRFDEDGEAELILRAQTNADGRTDAPLLDGDAFEPGAYEIVFEAGAWLAEAGAPVADPPFLDDVPIRFAMAEETHYHVPLLLSAHGYSTYRGS